MIEVGKVITRREHYGISSGFMSYDDPPIKRPSEWVTVGVGPTGIALTIQQGSKSIQLPMTPAHAIELAQIMMKAAESQAEYAQARTELELEMTKLDESFKDRISGLGIGGIEEPETKTPLKSVGCVRDGVVIVEAG